MVHIGFLGSERYFFVRMYSFIDSAKSILDENGEDKL